ncbi:MAG: aminoacyl-tRNA hydrolase [Kineosporiaceae bacterium]|jgi:PTH1 family peptidyl-tRNA hydrolase
MNHPAGAGGDPDAVWLVVGLGNPGPRYAGNRHNVGAMAVDAIAAELGVRLTAHRSRADVAEVRLPPAAGRPGPRAVLAKPTSYMNESGGQVSGLLRFFKVDPAHVLVVHDELDLPFGEVRLKRGGGEAGHNGLRSVSQSIGTRDYCRVRVGIGRPPGRQDAADFVLRDFPTAQREEVALLVGDAADAVLDVLRDGWERAQTVSNTARKA